MAPSALQADGQSLREQAQGYGAEFFECWYQYMGDQVHHGYYDSPVALTPEDVSALKDDPSSIPRAASIRIIDELLAWANVSDDDLRRPCKILDVGCGIGGVSRHLATKTASGGSIQGISLEKVEIEMAKQITAAANLCEKVSFVQGDALDLPFPDNTYDLLICFECAEHIEDKHKLFSEFHRVMKPGGRLIVPLICPPEDPSDLSESDKEILKEIIVQVTGPIAPISRYIEVAQGRGFQAIKTENWTKFVIPGVRIMGQSFHDANVSADSKNYGVLGVYVEEFNVLLKGYEKGIVSYIAFTATKPSPSS